MTYSINWPITLRSAVPFRSGNYIFPCVCVSIEISKTLGMHLFLFDDILLLARVKKTSRKVSVRMNARLTAIFQDNLGKPVPECLHSGFLLELRMNEMKVTTGAIRRAKLQSKSLPPTYRPTPKIFTGWMSFLSPKPAVSEH